MAEAESKSEVVICMVWGCKHSSLISVRPLVGSAEDIEVLRRHGHQVSP